MWELISYVLRGIDDNDILYLRKHDHGLTWFRLFVIPAGQNDGIFLAPLSSALIVGDLFFDQVQCVALVEQEWSEQWVYLAVAPMLA